MKEIQKIRQKEIGELKRELKTLQEKLLTLNFDKEISSFKKTHQVRQCRRKIARILTILQEKSSEEPKIKK